MDSQRSDLVRGIWAAFNFEKMAADAWADCFQGFTDLRSDEYRKIVFIVVLLAVERPHECTPSTVQKIISRRDMLDEKTVATRVKRLIDCKLFEVVPHSKDKRKRVIRPTAKLLEPLKQYSQLTLDIANEIVRQAIAAGIPRTDIDPEFRFNLLDHLDGFESPSPVSDQVQVPPEQE
ncbi:MarR family winged helix-turn-helix transcriptional regulator [Bradyrhizobium sp. Cp5.3]|uniref:MarR family winged helix-turn-helix transcriptional regulator n=1 Tax=Bradyrhizobium sp. Cp5.3 TaxID=443598 RepID=UPI0004851F67|nr:MarR family winged helix-turn-helix transcriptional regulator [Bradyrhizobium sp. Cp5.3]